MVAASATPSPGHWMSLVATPRVIWTLALTAAGAILLISSGVGYLKQRKFLGRSLGNAYAVCSLAGTAINLAVIHGGFGIGTIIGLIWPVLTLILVNTTFKEGDEVKEGQTLYEIDPRSYQDSRDAAKAQLDANEASLELAKQNNVRNRGLGKANAGAIAQQALDTVAAELGVTTASVDQMYHSAR